jgi:CRISPR/Cas system-associated endoribonuclease Cas2
MTTEQKTKNQFDAEEFLKRVQNAIMKKEWGSAILTQFNTVKLEVVRIGNTDEIMIRVSGQKPGNALKLVTKEHLDNFLELAHAMVNNEGNLLDKLEALKGLLREGSSGGAVMV